MELAPLFFRFNPWWEGPFAPPGIARKTHLQDFLGEAKKKHITFITGLRRVGKTTILKQVISELLNQGIPPRCLFFLSLDHSALATYSLLTIVETYRQIHQILPSERAYLFFDEVQYHAHFEQDLKVLHDHENVKIFASGSNSLLLRDQRAFLTGRNVQRIINPLSFEEFLQFKGISLSQPYLQEQYFLEYLERGGMPEYVLTGDPEKITALVNNIIYKDIVGKHGLKNARKVEELFLLLCERVGKRVTYNKLAAILGIDVETVSSYISFFEETFLVYQVPRHARSLNEVVRSPKKIYLADNGLRSVFVGFKDKGALWENLVFLQVKDKKVRYFYEDNKEVDFIIELFPHRKCIAVEAKFKELVSEEEWDALNRAPCKEKMMISSPADLQKLRELIESHENAGKQGV